MSKTWNDGKIDTTKMTADSYGSLHWKKGKEEIGWQESGHRNNKNREIDQEENS